MLFVALATDFDGTLATDGSVDDDSIHALRQLKTAGKRLLLVTGRELPSLEASFPALDIFDIVIVENGALLYFPEKREQRLLSAAPPEALVAALRAKGVAPLSVGRGIVATWTPNEQVVLHTIRDLSLDWQITFNKGAVMCLPSGINKATGLAAALQDLKLLPRNVVGVGDAENDLAFMSVCGCAVAVANALDTVKAKADLVTAAARGAGVAELINRWLQDPGQLFAKVHGLEVYLGDAAVHGDRVSLRSDDGAVLIAGSSGVGKSRLTSLLVERMAEAAYQVFIMDPEGDYSALAGFTVLGDAQHTPKPEEVMAVLQSPNTNVAVNLLGTEVNDRPAYFRNLMGQIAVLRASLGRPHWIILDETHHLSPRTASAQQHAFPAELSSAIFITHRPEDLSLAALSLVQTIIAVGEEADQVVSAFCAQVGMAAPPAAGPPQDNEALAWRRASNAARRVTVGRPKQAHVRHTRKYAEGRLGEDKSFYFLGPSGAMRLRAYNLLTFLELARGVDDETWLFHLHLGHYSDWFRTAIKNEDLANDAQAVESQNNAESSRASIADAIKQRYVVCDTD